ncbi:hypothetical protein Ddc_15838 [Ditylenchus destructor]|nr:hypothetical protein Ddc_15838 [Ditylenchus destructor]
MATKALLGRWQTPPVPLAEALACKHTLDLPFEILQRRCLQGTNGHGLWTREWAASWRHWELAFYGLWGQ